MKFAKALILSIFALAITSAAAFAQDGSAAAGVDQYASLGAGLAIGVAAFGGALGQGRTMSSALEGISRNPGAQNKIFIPMIIGLALIESLVLYAFVIAFVKIQYTH